MLVLTRKQNESIVIGENGEIVVTLLQGCVGNIRIGIEAPKDVAVDRKEIFERKQAERNRPLSEQTSTTHEDC
ncbi:MAG: carbon storage regulator [Gammaproteobacteria bacterium]|nr:carbon storage regulator [Gammaproteobacteria bacterium]